MDLSHKQKMQKEGKAETVQSWPFGDLFDKAPKNHRNSIIRREELFTKGAFMLHGALSRKECERIVKSSESMGFTDAALNLGNGKSAIRSRRGAAGGFC